MATKGAEKEYTMEEVKKHNTSDSCWLAINNNVYDVTKFMANHPGGEEIVLEEAGDYATAPFKNVRHSKYANDLLKKYLIGVLVEADREQITEKADGGSSCCTML